jgi:hypothetical protein
VNHDPQARRQLRRIDRWRLIWAASRNHLASRSILADAQLAFMRRVQAAAQQNLSRRFPRVGLAGIFGRWPMAWTRKKAVAGVSGLLAVGLVAGLIAAFATNPPAPKPLAVWAPGGQAAAQTAAAPAPRSAFLAVHRRAHFSAAAGAGHEDRQHRVREAAHRAELGGHRVRTAR